MLIDIILRLFGIVRSQPYDKFDDQEYDVNRVTDDDNEERDPLPAPSTDSLLAAAEKEPERKHPPPACKLLDLPDLPFWNSIVDLTDKSNVKDSKGRRRRKGRRRWDRLRRLVWHQTGFAWKTWKQGKWSSHHKINAHICIDTNGKILLLHPLWAYLWTANGFNPECLSIEIMGNFEGVEGAGNWYKPEKFGYGHPKAIQIKRCRQLTYWLLHPEMGLGDTTVPKPLLEWRVAVRRLGRNPLKFVHAHRQSGYSSTTKQANRLLDPGSKVWSEVGVWAQEEHGLSDGGPGYHLQHAAPIPIPEWDARMREDTPLDEPR